MFQNQQQNRGSAPQLNNETGENISKMVVKQKENALNKSSPHTNMLFIILENLYKDNTIQNNFKFNYSVYSIHYNFNGVT